MKVSIALATYNGEKYLKEQLESLYCQTQKPDEVIISDDGSNDKTVQIVKEFISENHLEESWHLYMNKQNKGYAGNFYHALELCQGDIIFFCDQDDVWNLNKIELMTELMRKNSKIQMLACDYEPYRCTEDAPHLSKEVMARMKDDGTLEKITLNHHTIFIGSEGCAMCIRKDFFEEIRKYWFPDWAHDEFIWKLSLCKDGCYLYHKILFKRRLHSTNVSKKKMHTLDKRIVFLRNLQKSHQKTLEFAHDLVLDKKTLEMIKKNRDSVKLRLELIENKKWINVIPLMFKYLKYYSNKRSILVELIMSIKGNFIT